MTNKVIPIPGVLVSRILSINPIKGEKELNLRQPPKNGKIKEILQMKK
jgi:hypothetical protein